MTNIITHQGIVENISGSQVFVRIIQTSACSTCSVKGHCSSADSKEKVIEVTDTSSCMEDRGRGDDYWCHLHGHASGSSGFSHSSLSFNLWPFHFQDSSS